MMSKIVYRTSVTATGGRDGRAKNEEGSIDITLAVPKEMGGNGNGNGNNPEQLFAAGYSACFLGAMKYAVSQNGDFPRISNETTVTATVGIGPRDDKGFGLTVDLEIHIPDVDVAAVQALVDEADTICPYSHAVRGNIPVTVKAV